MSDLCKEEAPCNTVIRSYSDTVTRSYSRTMARPLSWLCLTSARRKHPAIQSYGHTVIQLRGYTVIQWYDLSLLAVSDLCWDEAACSHTVIQLCRHTLVWCICNGMIYHCWLCLTFRSRKTLQYSHTFTLSYCYVVILSCFDSCSLSAYAMPKLCLCMCLQHLMPVSSSMHVPMTEGCCTCKHRLMDRTPLADQSLIRHAACSSRYITHTW